MIRKKFSLLKDKSSMVTAQTVEAGNIRAKKKQKKQEILSKIKDFFTFNTQH